MSAKLAIIFADKNKFIPSFLTNMFTGCEAYHVAWVDEGYGLMWDMNLLRRRRLWPYYKKNVDIYLFTPPVTISFGQLEHMLSTDTAYYGFLDYLSFLFKRVLKRIGITKLDFKGTICSEMIVNDLVAAGWNDIPKDWLDSPPSPCDLFSYFIKQQSPKLITTKKG